MCQITTTGEGATSTSTVPGALSVTGDFTVLGSFTFGDASTDNLIVTGSFSQTYNSTGDGHLVAGNGNLTAGKDLVRFSSTGSLSSTSNVVAIEQGTGAGTAGAYGLYVNCTGANVEAIKVDAGAVVFDETLTVSGGYIMDGAVTTGLSITGATTTGVSITGSATDAIKILTGTYTTGINVGGTLTTGVSVGAATTGVALTGATTTGISITGSSTDAIKILTGTFTTGVNVGGTLTTGVSIGAATTGLAVTGATTTAVSVTGSATDAFKVSTGTYTNGLNIGGTVTTGVTIGAATTGIALTGATTTGVSITGSATDAIKILTGTFGTGVNIAGTLTTGVSIGAATTGISMAGATTTGISFTAGAGTMLNANAAAAAASVRGVFIGEDSDSAQNGIPLLGASWSTSQGNAFYCDDDGVALVGYTEAMTVRMLTTAAVTTGDVSTVAIHPNLTLNANYTGSGGLSSIWGNTTIKATKTVDTSAGLRDVGGATFGLDVNGTLAANTHGCGVSVGLGGSGTKNGITTGFRMRAPTGTVLWDGFASISDDGTTLAAMTTTGSNTGTLTNCPHTGNPAYWVNFYIGTTKYVFPVFASS